MRHTFDDGYVDVVGQVRELEYLIKRIGVHVDYICSLSEDDDDSSFDDEDEDLSNAGIRAMGLQMKLNALQQATEDMKMDVEQVENMIHKLRRDMDWYGESS